MDITPPQPMLPKLKEIYFGIDPGTKTSPTAIVCCTVSDGKPKLLCLKKIDPPIIERAIVKSFKSQSLNWDMELTASLRKMADAIHAFIMKNIEERLIQHQGIIHIFCEEPALMGKANKNMLKLLGVIEYVLSGIKNHRIYINYINPSTSKRVTAGYGSADKELVKSTIQYRLGIRHENFIKDGEICYDISDALSALIAGGNIRGLWEWKASR